jgi:hypothetical protein
VAHETAGASQLLLPTLVFGMPELHRLARELAALDSYFEGAKLRTGGTAQPALPKVSRLLDALASENKRNLLQSADRQVLAIFLRHVIKEAPSVHISFAADPSAVFTSKIVSWLRSTIHPHMLLSLGLQPTIAAGCVVRTPNKLFDFSLRNRFNERRQTLLDALETQQNER